jgi:transcriptional regulator with XRE-family HTH domain
MEDNMPRPSKKNPQLHKEIGKRIRAAREQTGWTQERLAEALDVQPETVSRYEIGAIPLTLEKLFEVAQALDIGVESILGLQELSRKSSPRETEIVQRWKGLSRKGQDLILDLLKWAATK